jgi:hypothetical protein
MCRSVYKRFSTNRIQSWIKGLLLSSSKKDLPVIIGHFDIYPLIIKKKKRADYEV